MAKYNCKVCGYIYDESEGDLVHNVLPGTVWNEVAEDWVCPVCGVGKDQFEKIEEIAEDPCFAKTHKGDV